MTTSDEFTSAEAQKSFSIFLPTKDILEQLGEMLVLFQQVEKSLRWFACTLLDSNDTKLDHVVLSQLSFGRLVSVVRALAAERFTPQHKSRDRIEEMLKKCAKVEQRRNQFTHSDWGRTSDVPSSARRKRPVIGKLGFYICEEKLDAHDLCDFNRQLENLFGEAIALMSDSGLALVQREAERY